MSATELSSLELSALVRRSVMLSMALTSAGADAYTHDDYDAAMAALDELGRRARVSETLDIRESA